MYEAFYGLTERPFELTSNPRFLFLTASHREALGNLRYGLSTPRGVTVLLGEAGTGKTTLLRAALGLEQREGSRYVLLDNPTLTRAEFYEFLAIGFGLDGEAARSKARFIVDLRRDLQERAARGGIAALIVDEAQSLPDELLEELRLLANIETTTAKLLNVILSGQPELAVRLNADRLRPLKQRVALRCELRALELRETAAYIAGRLRIAGAARVEEIFTREAVVTIHRLARGIPRTVSVICDNALLGGFAANRRPIDEDLVLEVARDFDLGQAPASRPGTDIETWSATSNASGITPSAAHQDGLSALRPGSLPAAVAPAVPASRTGTAEEARPLFADVTAPRRRFLFF